MDRILDLFASRGVRATFFTLGWVATRYSRLVRRIVAEGHELASHGWSHVRATEQDREAFAADVMRTKALLEDLAGTPVLGYRAASYSIGERNLWALTVLAEVGYRYLGIYPIRHDLYGMPAPRFAFRPNPGSAFLEIPVTTVRWRRPLPAVRRLLPAVPLRPLALALRRVNRRDGQACVFTSIPADRPDQPRQTGVGARTRFRHYLNLHRMERRLGRLLADFRWGRMDEVFLGPGAGGA
jgi:polysaccharide deacetylase family protein (PEP-CTERM system associated)